jgi:hypothetical protein
MAYGGESYQQAWDRVQQQLHPQVIRFFNGGTNGPAWPSKTGDAPLVISFKIPPAQVLNGSYDNQLRTFFAQTPQKTYWTYWHEPEDDIERGSFTAAQYRSAWAHIASIAKASGKPLVSTLILMGWTTKPASHRTWTDYYPGSDVIDVVAWDCYATTSDATPESMYASARAASVSAGKPWAIAETAASEHRFPDPQKREAMLTSMSRWLAASNPQPVFVTYFDSDTNGKPNANISKTPPMASAWVRGMSQ